jgi:hypothetical protein
VLQVWREACLRNVFFLKLAYLFCLIACLLSFSKVCTAGTASGNWPIFEKGNLSLISGPEDDSTLQWYVTESAHFRVLHPVHLQHFSLFLTDEAEKIFHLLKTWTGYSPRKKIDILLSSRSDFANGYVAPGPRGLFLTVYAVHPYRTALTGLDVYREWYASVLLHELTHVFHIDMKGGLPLVMSKVFGNVVYPNSCTPPFYIEGFAVYSETVNQYGYGRAHSPLSRMHIRTACLQHMFPTIDLASNDAAIWPMGQARYVYGGAFVQHLAVEFGESTLFEFNRKSGSCLAYTWGNPFRNVYAKSAHRVWDEWKKKEEERSEEVVNRLKSAGVDEYALLSGEKGFLYSLAVNQRGDLVAYSLRPLNRLGGLYIFDRKTGTTRCMKKGLCAFNIRFSNDGSRIFYLRSDIESNVSVRINIHELDLRTGKEKRITAEGGVQGFSVLREENRFLVCRSSPWGTELGFFGCDRENARFSCVKPFEDGALQQGFLLEDPVLSPDGRHIAFSFRDAGGTRGICYTPLRGLEEGRAELIRVTDSRSKAYSPRWLNSRELMFVGDENGVYNLYTVNILSGETQRKTNVLTGVFEPSVSEDAFVVCAVYSAGGFQVSKMHMDELDTVYWEQETEIGPLAAARTKAAPGGEADSSYSITRYRPGRWLLPGGWLPFMTGNGVGFGIGFYTHGNDLLKKHEYSIGLVYDVYDSEYTSVFSYFYNCPHFSYFGRFFAAQASFRNGLDPYFAFSPGISYTLRKHDFTLGTEIAWIFENPYGGIAASFSVESTKQSIGWIGPDRGVIFQQGMYHNLRSGIQFTAFDTDVSVYSRPFGALLLLIQCTR